MNAVYLVLVYTGEYEFSIGDHDARNSWGLGRGGRAWRTVECVGGRLRVRVWRTGPGILWGTLVR